MVSIYENENAQGQFVITFVPKGPQHERRNGEAPKRVPQFIVSVRQSSGELTFDWGGTPDDPGAAREEMEAEIVARMKEREAWIHRVVSLVDQVEQWAREMDWSTRRIEKRLDDSFIGKHVVPALLLQQETCRALLEPIGRSSADANGVVDLYVMPAYDDIAVLFHYDNRWNLHYNTSRGTNAVVPTSKTESLPLSKETLKQVLAEIKQHAAYA